MDRTSTVSRLSVLVTLATLAACSRGETAAAPAAPPQVEVAQVLSRQITEFEEFTGRFEAGGAGGDPAARVGLHLIDQFHPGPRSQKG